MEISEILRKFKNSDTEKSDFGLNCDGNGIKNSFFAASETEKAEIDDLLIKDPVVDTALSEPSQESPGNEESFDEEPFDEELIDDEESFEEEPVDEETVDEEPNEEESIDEEEPVDEESIDDEESTDDEEPVEDETVGEEPTDEETVDEEPVEEESIDDEEPIEEEEPVEDETADEETVEDEAVVEETTEKDLAAAKSHKEKPVKARRAIERRDPPKRRTGINMLFLLITTLFIGVSGFFFAAAPSAAFNPLLTVNVYDYLIGGESAILLSIYSEGVAIFEKITAAVSSGQFELDQAKLTILISDVIMAIVTIEFIFTAIYVFFASVVNVFASKTEKLYALFSRLVFSIVKIVVFSFIVDVSMFSSGLAFNSAHGFGVGLIAATVLGIALLIVFGALERRKAAIWGVSRDKIYKCGRAYLAFFGHVLIIAATGLLSFGVFLFGTIKFGSLFVEKLATSVFEPFALLDAALFVLFVVAAMVIPVRAIKKARKAASCAFSVNVHDPDENPDADRIISKRPRRKLRKEEIAFKKAIGYIGYVVFGILALGGIAFLMFVQPMLYDMSSVFNAMAMLPYALVFAAIIVVSIVFQVLSHLRRRA